MEGLTFDNGGKFLAGVGGKFFTVVNLGDFLRVKVGGKDDGGNGDWSGQGASADFIDADN